MRLCTVWNQNIILLHELHFVKICCPLKLWWSMKNGMKPFCNPSSHFAMMKKSLHQILWTGHWEYSAITQDRWECIMAAVLARLLLTRGPCCGVGPLVSNLRTKRFSRNGIPGHAVLWSWKTSWHNNPLSIHKYRLIWYQNDGNLIFLRTGRFVVCYMHYQWRV